MSDKTQGTYRGFLTADPRINHDTLNLTLSTVDQDGVLPGIPKDISDPPSPMVFESTGEPPSSKVLVRTQRGGFPGVSARSGGFITKFESDAADQWLGWDVPNAFESIRNVPNSAPNNSDQIHAIRTNSGAVLAVLRSFGLPAGPMTVNVRKVEEPTGLLLDVATLTPEDTSPALQDLYPCLVQLPSDRLLLFFWVVDTDAEIAQIQMWYSDDEGETWTQGSRYCLSAGISTSTYELGRIRGAHNAGQVLLVAEIRDPSKVGPGQRPEALVQWGSDDNGTTFAEVYRFDLAGSPTENGASPEVIPLRSGGFAVHYASTQDRTHRYRRLSNAFHAMGVIAESDPLPHPENIDPDLAVWKAEDNTQYATARLRQASASDELANNMVVMRSIDDGVTWTRMELGTGGATLQGLWRDGGDLAYPTQFCVVEGAGQSLMFTAFQGHLISGFDDTRLYMLVLGGHSTLTRGSLSLFREDTRQISWDRTWVGVQRPSVAAPNIWTQSVLGAPTVSLGAPSGVNGMVVDVASGEVLNWRFNLLATPLPEATVTRERMVRSQLTLISEIPVGEPRCVLRLIQANGSSEYGLEIWFWKNSTEYGYTYVDREAMGSPVSVTIADNPVDNRSEFEILVAQRGGNYAVYHRPMGSSSPFQRGVRTGWVEAVVGTLIERTSVPRAYEEIRWGALDIGSTAVSVAWASLQSVTNPIEGVVGLSEGFNNPKDLFPRGISRDWLTLPRTDTRISAVDGPTMQGDTWEIGTRSLYGVDLVDPQVSSSPRQVWRTPAGDTTEQTLVWDMSEEDTPLFTAGAGGSWGVAILGANWRTATLYGVTAAGTEVEIMAIDMAAGLVDVPYIREGNIGRVGAFDADLNAGVWVDEHELAGATVLTLDSGDSAVEADRILSNTQGLWTAVDGGSPHQTPVVHLASTTTTSGSATIVRPNGVFWRRDLPAPGKFRRIKLVIDAQTTASGRLETGNIIIGPAYMFGRDYSEGRVIDTEANTQVATLRGGTRYSRKLGPDRRTAQIGWREGVDTTPTHRGDPASMDYAQAGTTGPATLTTPSAVPGQVEGILRRHAGQDIPLVYLASVDGTADGVVSLVRRGDFVYGRLDGGVRQESFLGEEQDDEVIRVSNVEISEEV